MSDTILIRIAGCPYSLSRMMERIAFYQRALPTYEVFMDGDRYAIVARPRTVRA